MAIDLFVCCVCVCVCVGGCYCFDTFQLCSIVSPMNAPDSCMIHWTRSGWMDGLCTINHRAMLYEPSSPPPHGNIMESPLSASTNCASPCRTQGCQNIRHRNGSIHTLLVRLHWACRVTGIAHSLITLDCMRARQRHSHSNAPIVAGPVRTLDPSECCHCNCCCLFPL